MVPSWQTGGRGQEKAQEPPAWLSHKSCDNLHPGLLRQVAGDFACYDDTAFRHKRIFMLWVLRAYLFQVNCKLIGRYDVYNTGKF